MKLLTQNGQLDLPQDFSLLMQRNNPFLSEEGDASVPATLPSSPHNLAVLGHRERIDRAERYTNKVDAILQVGAVQKRGSLVMDTVHRSEGIDASLAIDSSDLYVKAKEKTLKQIFEETNTEGVSKITFGNVEGAMDIMQDCYEGVDTFDFTIFPVAIAPYETTVGGVKVTNYQFNNEVDNNHQLVWQARTTHEGDIQMYVPEGYGIAPFLKLHRLLHRLFQCLGYTVTENCFDDSAGNDILSHLVILHNCSDCLVRPTLYYQDLVPSCKLSEFLEWLLAKFHAQPVVDSETRTVKIVLLEDILASTPDEDLSELVEDNMKLQLSQTKRIVLTPTTSIEGTAAAHESFDKLVQKYGGYVECDEDQWDANSLTDCLLLRLATGQFYALTRNLSSGNQVKELLGTNYFPYDRDNSDETEAFSQSDVMPLMLVDAAHRKRDVSPFIGERLHYHTSYNGEKEDDKQEIILCQYAFAEDNSHNKLFAFWTTGTTQGYIPYATSVNGVSGMTLQMDLTNFGLYDHFWRRYNNLILNHAVHITGQIKLNLGQFLNFDMSRMKLCQGQTLLPVSASASLSDRFGLTEVEMILAKTFSDGVTDTPITPSQSTGLKWVLHFEGETPSIYEEIWDDAVTDYENTHPTYAVYDSEMTGYSIAVSGTSGSQFLGVPTFEGQTVDIGNHDLTITVQGIVYYKDTGVQPPVEGQESLTDYRTFRNAHCYFVAEPA